MIASLVALLCVGQDGLEAKPVGAAPLITKMLAHYSEAKTLVGSIVLTQSISGQSGQIETLVQFERPSLLFIRQMHKKARPKVWMVCSTGKVFTYDAPNDIPEGMSKRLAESQVEDGKVMSLQAVYQAAGRSLGDRSAPLDIAIGNLPDLQFLRNQWASLVYEGRTAVGEQEVHLIRGQWREYGLAPVSGSFELYVTEAGDLKRYIVKENLVVDQRLGPQRLVSTWDVDLKVDAKPDASLFRLYR